MGKTTQSGSSCNASRPAGIIGRLRSQHSRPRNYQADALSDFLVELSGVEVPPFGQAPANDKLLAQITTNELDATIRGLKLKSRKGAKAETQAIRDSLISQTTQRVKEITEMPRDERPKQLFSEEALHTAVLRNEKQGPIAEALLGRISSGNGLEGIEGPEVLAFFASEEASPQAREILDSKLRGLARQEILDIKHGLKNRYGRVQDFSTTSGYFQHSSKGTLIHLVETSGRWGRGTACGKSGPHLAKWGAWNDAEFGGRYRRCRACEKNASEELVNKATEEQRSDPPEGAEKTDISAIVDSPKLRKALLEASEDQVSFAGLKSSSQVAYSRDFQAGLRSLICENAAPAVTKVVSEGPAHNAVWAQVPASRVQYLRLRISSSKRDDVFTPDTVPAVIELYGKARVADLNGDSNTADSYRQEISDMLDKQIDDFMARTESEVENS